MASTVRLKPSAEVLTFGNTCEIDREYRAGHDWLHWLTVSTTHTSKPHMGTSTIHVSSENITPTRRCALGSEMADLVLHSRPFAFGFWWVTAYHFHIGSHPSLVGLSRFVNATRDNASPSEILPT